MNDFFKGIISVAVAIGVTVLVLMFWWSLVVCSWNYWVGA